MSHESQFFESLRSCFVGLQLDGDSPFARANQLRANYYFNKMLPAILQSVETALAQYPEEREELFTQLSLFCSELLSEDGVVPQKSTIRSPMSKDCGRDPSLLYSTREFFFARIANAVRDLTVHLDPFTFTFNVASSGITQMTEKSGFYYTLANTQEKVIEKIALTATPAERGRKFRIKDLKSQLDEVGFAVAVDVLRRVIRAFEAQCTTTLFLLKNPWKFLHERLDDWLRALDITREKESPTIVEGPIQKLEAYCTAGLALVDSLAQFESERVRIWNEPKQILSTHFVITLDKTFAVIPRFLEDVEAHPNFPLQIVEWKDLGLVSPEFLPGDLFNASKKSLSHLPLDTKYFPNLEPEILAAFTPVDDYLNGWLINGENYQTLRTILPQFREEIKVVYIDPPFNKGGSSGNRKNTGKGGDGDFLYSVNYQAAEWVALLENRLTLAREFLAPAGSIFVRCGVDGNMLVRMLMDEIFGADNFRNEIIVRRAEASKGEFVKQFGAMRSMTVNYDNLYWYSRNPAMRLPLIAKPAPPAQQPARWHSLWKAQYRPRLRYELLGVTPPKGQWMWNEERARAAIVNHEQYLAEASVSGESLEEYWRRTGESLEFVKKEGTRVGAIKYWIPPRATVVADNNWLDIKGYANTWRFKTENSEPLLRRVVEGTSAPGDLVMDFFLGSGTTAAVAHKLGRRWIGIEMGNHFETIILPRLKEVLAGGGNHELCGISKDIGWSGGGFFKYITLETFEDAWPRTQLADFVKTGDINPF